MFETFTPAVCGSRSRQRVASAFFTASALATAGALGGLLGFTGDVLGARRVVLAAAALALLAAAREAGLVRLPVPQSRRQVPEGWRFRLPLPVWATGYGAGLGAGIFTYQPVSTFWVACAGALALGRPLPAALCFSLYGAGRTVMVAWPRRRPGDPTEAVERLVRRRGALIRVNTAALGACAALLALAPVAGGALVASGLDPSIDRGVLAWAQQDGSVVVRDGGTDYPYPGASAPSVDGDLLAYVDTGGGIRVARWRTGVLQLRITTTATAVALDWPWLAFRREDPTRRRIVLRNLETGSSQIISSVALVTDLGRPALRSGKLLWHIAGKGGSRIELLTIAGRARRTLRRSDIALLCNPSVYRTRFAWIELRSGTATIRTRSLAGGTVRTIARIKSRDLAWWSTALAASNVYATRWSLGTRTATVHSFGY